MPLISTTGFTVTGLIFTVEIASGVGGATGLLFIGGGRGSIPALCGTLLTDPLLSNPFSLQLGGPPGAPGAGTASFPIWLPDNPLLIGTPATFHGMLLDPGSTCSVSMTQGLETWIG